MIRSAATFSVSQGACADPIVRVENPESASPTVVNYTSGTTYVDGLGFTPNGTLFVVDGPRGTSTTLETFQSTASASPGALIANVATVPYGDGITFSKPVANGSPQYAYVNRNDGMVTRVDLTTSPAAELDIMSGGTRGDFMTTGPDGCLYPTQSTSVAKITFTDGSCDGLPTDAATPLPATTTSTTTPPATTLTIISTTAPPATNPPGPTTTGPPTVGVVQGGRQEARQRPRRPSNCRSRGSTPGGVCSVPSCSR